MKKIKKLISFLLCFALVLSFIPTTAYAGLVGTEKAQLKMVLLKEDAASSDGSGYTALTEKEIEKLNNTDNSTFYLGVKMVGMDNISEMVRTTPANAAGLRSMSIGIDYRSDYLQAEPDFWPDYGSGPMADPTSWLDVIPERLQDDANSYYKVGNKYKYDGDFARDTNRTPGAGEEWKTVFVKTTYRNASISSPYTGTKDCYMIVVKFNIVNKPAAGAKAFDLSPASDDFSLMIGTNPNAKSYQLDDSGTDTDVKTVMDFNFDDANKLFPKQKTPLEGTVSITGNTTYGETLTADTSGLTNASGGFSYQWSVGGKDISGATNQTLVVNNPAWAGQKLTCTVEAADNSGSKAGESATIAKKTLAVSGTVVADKTFDNTTAATIKTQPTVTGKVNTSDAVTVTASATFADKNAGTNKNATVTYALSGAAANAYQLDKITETLTANISKKQLEVVGNNASVKIGGTATLSAKVTGEVNDAPAGVTYTYAIKAGTSTVIGLANGVATGLASGSEVVTATGTITDTTNYEFATGKNAADLTVTVAAKVPKSIAVKTQPTKKDYEAGNDTTLDLSGLVVTVTYDDNSTEDVALADFAAKGITTDPENGATLNDTSVNKVVVTINGKTADVPITVSAATTKVTLATKGAITKKYDGTTAVDKTAWTTEPVFTSNNGTVNTDNAVYTFAQSDVGTCDVTVTGLTVNGEAASISGSVADGTITIAEPTITLGNLSQTVGSVTAPTWTFTPTDAKAVEGKFKTQIEITTPEVPEVPCTCVDENGDPKEHDPANTECHKADAVPAHTDWVAWADANVNSLTAGTYNVKVIYEGSDNTSAKTVPGELKLANRSTGGGGSSAITVTFKAGTNGKITDGKASVSVNRNAQLTKANIPTVTANDGFKFLGWSLDGKTVVDPTEAKVTKSITYTALYEAVKGGHESYMFGYADGTFQPNSVITRAEAAALIARLNPDYDLTANYTGTLKDLPVGAWFTKVINFNVEKGFITGYTDGTFKPNNPITRQEFCTIVAKYLGLENTGEAKFTDTKGVYAEGFIAQLVEKNIVSGYNDGSFKPNANITRAEATRILNGVFGRTPNKETVDAHIAEYTVNLKDVPATHWAYYEILEAAVNHTPADFHK